MIEFGVLAQGVGIGQLVQIAAVGLDRSGEEQEDEEGEEVVEGHGEWVYYR